MELKFWWKKSYSNIGLISFGNMLSAGAGFLFIAAIAKILPFEDFGKYALVTSLIVSTAKLTDFGTNSIYVSENANSKTHNLDKYLTLKSLLFLLSLPITFIILNYLKISDPTTILLFYFGFFSYVISFFLFGVFQKEESFISLLLLNIIPASIKGILGILIFTNLLVLNYQACLAVFSFSVIPSLLLAINLKKINFSYNFKLAKVLFFQTIPAGVAQFLNESWSAIANSIVKISLGFADTGVYALADKISSIFTLIATSIFTVLLPKNAKDQNENNKYDFVETILIGIGLIALALISILATHIVLPIIFGSKFNASIEMLDIMIWAGALTAIHVFVENYFYVVKKTFYLLGIWTTKLTAFFIACFVLIPLYGLKGMALAQLISASCAVTIALLGLSIGYRKHKQ